MRWGVAIYIYTYVCVCVCWYSITTSRRDLSGIMVTKGNHPQMALFALISG